MTMKNRIFNLLKAKSEIAKSESTSKSLTREDRIKDLKAEYDAIKATLALAQTTLETVRSACSLRYDMKKLFNTSLAVTALIIGNSASVQAQGVVDPYGWLYGKRLKAIKGGNCAIGELIMVKDYGTLNGLSGSTCVDPGSWIRTQNGGRVQWILKVQYKNQITIGSAVREVNCRTMESRSRSLWSLINYKPKGSTSEPGKDGWWSKYFSKSYSDWQPIEDLDGQNQYICERWRTENDV
ncbi:hypothetical protein MITS9509_03494 [Synechococcus sp. MIT S9509]|uniref:hypothetical protein n=1 Tax=Synechococcus sp. MIT S9509 TaxID=1801630 RepID=UPI0007BB26D1|nr:hypothetical protein [Synechococcus sp. MIT S9509]KZR86255.1 hypothetical protein MITS9509_03494 [Synechococcus sp. MIT S9509]